MLHHFHGVDYVQQSFFFGRQISTTLPQAVSQLIPNWAQSNQFFENMNSSLNVVKTQIMTDGTELGYYLIYKATQKLG